ncbi:hypothetical protein CONPUDRAFT_163328 [Coniophora puteana RWD-64-598 SS2]|uniref:Uncharacterized protein n=1 Tax=Coniophora puteana (strain RWD-64-598) TaxID=741705 RepID=A0A5M3MZ76_CONPW|nr:uncharacterized protein CONPUDRAFT_163328 [Coniophora puteana RWD-64-598 SS2]EIW84104.1 hypothetical protein CONPUDRAFT_163328 [Coniophora puteana RWD-64-598 SS2]
MASTVQPSTLCKVDYLSVLVITPIPLHLVSQPTHSRELKSEGTTNGTLRVSSIALNNQHGRPRLPPRRRVGLTKARCLGGLRTRRRRARASKTRKWMRGRLTQVVTGDDARTSRSVGSAPCHQRARHRFLIGPRRRHTAKLTPVTGAPGDRGQQGEGDAHDDSTPALSLHALDAARRPSAHNDSTPAPRVAWTQLKEPVPARDVLAAHAKTHLLWRDEQCLSTRSFLACSTSTPMLRLTPDSPSHHPLAHSPANAPSTPPLSRMPTR